MLRLSGNTLTPAGRIRPESCALTLTERASTATITLPAAEAAMAVGDWLLEDTNPGAGIVWRVKTVDDTYNTETSSITLEHAINTLRDISMFGEAKPGDITGNKNDKACTARQAAEYVLRHQTIWQLGDFEYDLSAPFSFNGDDLYSALEKISGALDEPWWDYDMTRMPFRLHIRKKSSQKACEMRMGRNITTLRKTVDRSQMYTRLYPIGKKNLHLTGDYVSKNEEIWGRRDKVETDQSQETEEALRIWATDRLNRHCEPQVTITIGGLELSQATGEKLDHLVLGTICQVPLPEFGTTIIERITKLAWKDKIKEPENVTVTLCNVRQDLASIISQQAAGGGGGGRAAAKEAEEDHAWFVDNTDHVAMVAEAVAGKDENGGPDWSRVSEIIADGTGIHAMVVKTQDELVAASSKIDMNEDRIIAEVKRATDAENELMSSIQITADKITEVSGRVDKQGELIDGAKLAIDGANARINAEAKRIDEANGEISSAKLAIDGANARIDAEAKRIDEANGEISSAKLAIDGANAAITAEAKRASEAEGELTGKLTVASDEIKAEVKRAKNKEDELSASIQVNADAIALKVSQTTFDELGNRVTKAESSITQHADEIAMRVKKGDIASEINQTPQSVKISASKIELSGYVTATEFSAEKGRFDSLVAGNTRAKNLAADGFTGDHMQLAGNATIEGDLTIHGFDFDLHKHRIVDNLDGTFSIGNPTWSDANSFKIADTKTYKDGVSAAKNSVTVSGSWSGGRYTASASNGVHAAYTWIGSGTKTVTYDSDSHTYSISVPIMYSNDGGALVGNTGQTVSATTGTEAYDAGQNSVTLDDPVWRSSSTYSNQAVTVSASNGKSKVAYIYLTAGSWSNGSKRVYMRSDSSSGTIRAQISVDAPSVSYTWDKNAKNNSKGTVTVGITIDGKHYTQTYPIYASWV